MISANDTKHLCKISLYFYTYYISIALQRSNPNFTCNFLSKKNLLNSETKFKTKNTFKTSEMFFQARTYYSTLHQTEPFWYKFIF